MTVTKTLARLNVLTYTSPMKLYSLAYMFGMAGLITYMLWTPTLAKLEGLTLPQRLNKPTPMGPVKLVKPSLTKGKAFKFNRVKMPINSKQFRELVVRPVLKHLHPVIPYSEVAEELLMLTVAHESDMGTFLAQSSGPARSVYQIEKPTFEWLSNYITKDHSLSNKVDSLSASYPFLFDELVWNLALATAFARLRYWVAKPPLPTTKDPVKLADYWGSFYQTTNDPIKKAEAIRDYLKFVKGAN